jgi:hypothetical protein
MASRPGTQRSDAVPELALLVGGVLGATALLYGLLFPVSLAPAVVVAVAVTLPFAAFAVTRSEDPTAVLPPRVVLVVGPAAGVVFGLAVALVPRWGVGPPTPDLALVGLGVALAVSLSSLGYALAYGGIPSAAPVPAAVVTPVAGLAVVAAAAAVGRTTLGLLDGTALALAGPLYAAVHGVGPGFATRRLVAAAGALVGSGLVVAATLDVLPGFLFAVGLAVAVWPAAYHALVMDAPGRLRSGR